MPTPESTSPPCLVETGEATALLPVEHGPPITVIGTPAIRATFDEICLRQAKNARQAPGVEALVLNPDAHPGFGAPIGCVMASQSHIYPGPVGVDVKCSMSLLQFELPAEALADPPIRRFLIEAICDRIPTGPGRGQRSVPLSRRVGRDLGLQALTEGGSPAVCEQLGIPVQWADRCEDAGHRGHDGTVETLARRIEEHLHADRLRNLDEKIGQLGSYGGGNHFGECEVVRVAEEEPARAAAQVFGLRDGQVAMLSHCGSRGLGNILATHQFHTLEEHFERWAIPFPGGDRKLCYAPLGTPEADAYLDDMALGANFATVNHLLINALILEAFQAVLPGVQGELVYVISHNIARQEPIGDRLTWVMRKGATRAFPAGHPGLQGTPFAGTGHPILLPGDPQRGSAVMIAQPGAERSLFSINHGAGRVLGRKQANRTLDQQEVDRSFTERDILTNCRQYPLDEAPAAYKPFEEVLRSVTLAGLARTVARLDARFVIKDASGADD